MANHPNRPEGSKVNQRKILVADLLCGAESKLS